MPPKAKAPAAKGKAASPAAKGKAGSPAKGAGKGKAKAKGKSGAAPPEEPEGTNLGETDDETTTEEGSPSPQLPPPPPELSAGERAAAEALKQTEEECQALKSQVSEMNERMRVQVEQAEAQTQKQCLEEFAQVQKMTMKMEEEQVRRDMERDRDDSISLKRLQDRWALREDQWQHKMTTLEKDIAEMRGRLAEREGANIRQELEEARQGIQKMREEKDNPTSRQSAGGSPTSDREMLLQKELEKMKQEMASLRGSQQQQLQNAIKSQLEPNQSSERERMLMDQLNNVRQDISLQEKDLQNELSSVRQEMTKTRQDLQTHENIKEQELLRQLAEVRREMGRVTDGVHSSSVRESELQQELQKVREEMEKNVEKAALNAQVKEEEVRRQLEQLRLEAANHSTQHISEREQQLEEELRQVRLDLERVAGDHERQGKEQQEKLLLELAQVRKDIGSSAQEAKEREKQLEQDLRDVQREMEGSGANAQHTKARTEAVRQEDAMREAIQQEQAKTEQMLWKNFEAMHEEATKRAAERENLLEAQLNELRSEMGSANAAKVTADEKKEHSRSRSSRQTTVPSSSATSSLLEPSSTSPHRALRKADTRIPVLKEPTADDDDDKTSNHSKRDGSRSPENAGQKRIDKKLRATIGAVSAFNSVGLKKWDQPPEAQSKPRSPTAGQKVKDYGTQKRSRKIEEESSPKTSSLALSDGHLSPRMRAKVMLLSPRASRPTRPTADASESSMSPRGSRSSHATERQRLSTGSMGDREIGRDSEKDSHQYHQHHHQPRGRHQSGSAGRDVIGRQQQSGDLQLQGNDPDSSTASGALRGLRRSDRRTEFGEVDSPTGRPFNRSNRTTEFGKSDADHGPDGKLSDKFARRMTEKASAIRSTLRPSESDGAPLPVLKDRLNSSINSMSRAVTEARMRLDGIEPRNEMATLTAARVQSNPDERWLIRSVDQMQKAVDLVVSHQMHTERHVMNDFCHFQDVQDETGDAEQTNYADEEEQQLAALLNPKRDESLWYVPASWSVPRTMLSNPPGMVPAETAMLMSALGQDRTELFPDFGMTSPGVSALPPSLWAAPPYRPMLSPMGSFKSPLNPSAHSNLDRDTPGTFQVYHEPLITGSSPGLLPSGSSLHSQVTSPEPIDGVFRYSTSPAVSPGSYANGVYAIANPGSPQVENHLLLPSSLSPDRVQSPNTLTVPSTTSPGRSPMPTKSTPETSPEFQERCKNFFAKRNNEKGVQKPRRADLDDTLRSLRDLTTEMDEAQKSLRGTKDYLW